MILSLPTNNPRKLKEVETMNSAPKSRQDKIVVQEIKNELLIYDLSLNRAYCLNETSALVWQSCNGNKTIDQISKELSQKLKTNISEDFVWLGLDRLKKENLLVNGEELPLNCNGLTRREVARKIGLTTLAALPLVTSLVAPSAVSAQSGTCGQSCQCSGLLANQVPLGVCPPGFADCPLNCQFCNYSPNGCFQGEGGVFACNGVCSNQSQPSNTCPSNTQCQCNGNANSGVSSCSAVLGSCPGTCSTCVTPIANCFKPGGEGSFVCPGICV